MRMGKIGLVILLVPVVAAVVLFPFLPSKIPVQFNLSGEVSRYASKYFIFLFALIPYLIYLSIKRKMGR